MLNLLEKFLGFTFIYVPELFAVKYRVFSKLGHCEAKNRYDSIGFHSPHDMNFMMI